MPVVNDRELKPQALKHLLGKELLKRMAKDLKEVYPPFDAQAFMKLRGGLEGLEMKARVQFLREELKRQLPPSYPQALGVLLDSARRGRLRGFDLWPYSDFVQTYGLEDLQASLAALRELTPLFSSEFAIRPFLKKFPRETLKYLQRCAADGDVDVRRWASEGCRPRLPWGERLQEFVRDPSPSLAILEVLKYDPELYVRKSVANHLNDIAKDHPERLIKLLAAWKKAAPGEHAAKVSWIMQRALRTLIKAGHPGALALIGVSASVQIKCSGLNLNQKQFKLGERLEFQFKIRSLAAKSQKLVIDYIVHFVKANQTTSPKVFKLKTLDLAAGEEVMVVKCHHLKKVSTRVHYSGRHYLEIQINGVGGRRIGWDFLV